jgi:polyphosphate kinase
LLDKKLKNRVLDEGLKIYLRDNVQAWDMSSNGHYRRKTTRRAEPHCAQSSLLEQLAN